MASGTEKRQRGDTITVRLTPDERAKVDTLAMERGLAVSAFMRAAALGDAGPRAHRRLPVDRKLLLKLLGEFGRVGNNLNQIAKTMNTGGKVSAAELNAALDAHAGIRAAIMKALEAPT